jgi:acetyl-CoA carboxylase biotin carboxylase subunit
VPPYYDSLVAKLLVHQPTRAEAIAVMRRALRELRIEGIHTTAPIHLRIMDDPQFAAGDVDTTYVERALLNKS